MRNAKERSGSGLCDDLDDSWFDRPEQRKVAAELRERIARQTFPSAAERNAAARSSGEGLDDSWFK